MNNVDEETIFTRSKRHVLLNTVPFLIFFLFFLIRLLFLKGYAYNPDTKMVFMEKYKYLHNFLEMPLVLTLLLIGIVGVLYGIGISLLKNKCTKGIWFAGSGTILTVMSLFLIAGFNHTAFYPSSFDLQSSLTIENSSSSKFTLATMSYVSLMVPFIIAYMWYAWWSMNKKKISREDLNTEEHLY